MNGEVLWLDGGHRKFRTVEWWELVGGDTIYYTIPDQKSREAREWVYGPFIVVDPDRRILMNMNGVKLPVPRVRPVYPVREEAWPDLRA